MPTIKGFDLPLTPACVLVNPLSHPVGSVATRCTYAHLSGCTHRCRSMRFGSADAFAFLQSYFQGGKGFMMGWNPSSQLPRYGRKEEEWCPTNRKSSPSPVASGGHLLLHTEAVGCQGGPRWMGTARTAGLGDGYWCFWDFSLISLIWDTEWDIFSHWAQV